MRDPASWLQRVSSRNLGPEFLSVAVSYMKYVCVSIESLSSLAANTHAAAPAVAVPAMVFLAATNYKAARPRTAA